MILIFLAGMGHLGFLTERVNLIFAKNEAVATPEEVSPSNSTQEKIPEPPTRSGFPDEKNEAGAALPDKIAEPPAPSPVHGNKPEIKVFTVEDGETLYAVLRKHYGRANMTLLDFVLLINPEVSDPHSLKSGCQIRIPALSEESLIRQSSGGDFQVHLATFAEKDLAENFKKEKKLEGRTLQIESYSVSSLEIWHRVLAGGYMSREEALNAAKGFRKKGLLSIFPPVS